jgi:hypothetical protein
MMEIRYIAVALLLSTVGCSVPPSTPTPSIGVLIADATPPTARLTMTIDSYGAQYAIAGVSAVAFDMTGSVGRGLRYTIDFGDGESVAAMSGVVRYTYPAPGSYTVTGTVMDPLGRSDSISKTMLVGWLGQNNNLRDSPCFSGWLGSLPGPPYLGIYVNFRSQSGRSATGLWTQWHDYRSETFRYLTFTSTLDENGGIGLVLDDGVSRLVGQVSLMGREDGAMALRDVTGSYGGQTIKFYCSPYA